MEPGPPGRAAAGLSSLKELHRRLTGPGLSGSTVRTLAVSVTGAFVSFVGQVILARSLGQVSFGVYLYALAVMNAVLVIGKLEQDIASTRFLAAYAGSAAWSHARGFMRWSRRVVTGSSLLVAGVGALVVAMQSGRIAGKDPALPAALLAACVLLVISAQLMLNAGQLQALRWYVASQWPGAVLRPLLLAGSIAALYLLLNRPLAPLVAVLVNVGATLAAVAVTARSLRAARPPEVVAAAATTDVRRWSRETAGLVATGLGQLVLSQQADLIVVGTLISVSDSALYGVASQFAFLVVFGQASVSYVTAPMMSELHARGDRAQLQRLLRSAFSANALVTLPVLAGLLAFGPWLLRLYGTPYVAAYPVLTVLCLASSIAGLVGGTAGFVLTMTGHQRQAAWIVASSAGTNIVLTLLLTARFGIMGTAAATFIATAMRGTLLVLFVGRRLALSVIPGWSGDR